MTSARASASLAGAAVAGPRTWSVLRTLLAPATAAVIVAASLLLLMTPVWMHAALDLSGGVGAQPTPELSYRLSDQTVAELFLGPGAFAAYAAGEAAHMRDVRVVLLGFLALAAVSLALLVWAIWRHGAEPATWRSIGRGGLAVAALMVAAGLFAALAFGVAFELFHRLLFPGGNWAFAADSLLIRLYPLPFWQLSAAALGGLSISAGLLVWLTARSRVGAVATPRSGERA